MDIRHISDEYTEIGMRLIQEREELQPLRDAKISVIFLASEHEKKQSGKVVYGQCEKVPEKWKWSVPCDFTITIFEPNIVFMNQKQLEILIFHELLHIGVSIEDDKFFVVPHDLEDFKTIIKQYGPDWAEPIPPSTNSDGENSSEI